MDTETIRQPAPALSRLDQWLAAAEATLTALTAEEQEEAADQLHLLLQRLGVEETPTATLPPPGTLRRVYLDAALGQAEYQTFADGTILGAIPACPGVLANEPTREACAAELLSVLDDWITVGLVLGHPIPVLGGIDLNPRRVS